MISTIKRSPSSRLLSRPLLRKRPKTNQNPRRRHLFLRQSLPLLRMATLIRRRWSRSQLLESYMRMKRPFSSQNPSEKSRYLYSRLQNQLSRSRRSLHHLYSSRAYRRSRAALDRLPTRIHLLRRTLLRKMTKTRANRNYHPTYPANKK